MKWNIIKNTGSNYTRGKLYCLDFVINKKSEGEQFYVNIKNSKTKDYFNTNERWNLLFTSIEEAKTWCENYARVSYYKIYNKYENWSSVEVPIPGRKGKKYLVFRPSDEEWNECLEKEKQWDKEIQNKFINTNVDTLID